MLVEASLAVRDSRGHAISGLQASDFDVLDNGIPQKIIAFSELTADGRPAAAPGTKFPDAVPLAQVPPPQPKYVTFFFDDYHGGASLFMMKAARAFIAKGLKAGEWVSIVTASSQGDLDFTTDANLLAEKLNHLASHDRHIVTPPCGVNAVDSYIVVYRLDVPTIEAAINAAKPCTCGGESERECRPKAQALADQLASASWQETRAQSIDTIDALGYAAKRLSQVNGARVLVLNSAGFLLGTRQPEMERFVDGAVKWGIVVHAIDENALGPASGLLRQSLLWTPLAEVTAGTGGHLFKNTNDLAGAMELAMTPEVTYLLNFNPGPRDGTFHKLQIRFKKKRPESVQFRPGYFSPPPEAAKAAPAARDPMDAAVFSSDLPRAIPAQVRVATGPLKDGNVPVSVSVTVDVSGLQFVESSGRHAQQIVFLMTLLDEHGGFVTGREAIMDLSLTDERLASMKEEGLKGVATLNAPPGAYRVRAIVREGMKGALSAWTVPVDLQ